MAGETPTPISVDLPARAKVPWFGMRGEETEEQRVNGGAHARHPTSFESWALSLHPVLASYQLHSAVEYRAVAPREAKFTSFV